MRDANPDKPLVPIKDRLSTRLGLIFVGTFLLVTILMIASTMLGAIGDRSLADSDPRVAAPVSTSTNRVTLTNDPNVLNPSTTNETMTSGSTLADTDTQDDDTTTTSTRQRMRKD